MKPMLRSNFSPVAVLLASVLCFHASYVFPMLSPLILAYASGLYVLAHTQTARRGFYLGLLAGLGTFGPQLHFFWIIFGPLAVVLWLVLSFWIGTFVALVQACLARFKPLTCALLVPFLWTGLEYFRSELYYLRFSWLNIGYAFSNSPVLPSVGWMGVYGMGFCSMLVVSLACLLPKRTLYWIGPATLLVLVTASAFSHATFTRPLTRGASIHVAGIQMEFPSELELPSALDQIVRQHPETELLVLSEYSLDGPVPERLKKWCRKNQRYLIVGGKEPVGATNFFNTAYVLGPAGDVVFQQAKTVPIQFFQDGLPAPGQRVWNSPWGKLGICICYDLSYTRVTDALILQGAQALIVPTMDVAAWGAYQHALHARVAPVRAAEYRIPIFRVASSGVSQLVNDRGRIIAAASAPGQNEIINGELILSEQSHLPFDRTLALISVAITAGILLRHLFAFSQKLLHQKKRSQPVVDVSDQSIPL